MKNWIKLLPLLFLFNACKKEDCVPPPPSLLLRLTRVSGALNTNLVLQYTKSGSTATVTDVRVTASTDNSVLLSTTEAIQMAPDITGNTYTLRMDDKPIGTILLQTSARTVDCDKWQHIDQLRFNGTVQQPSTNLGQGYYELIIP